MWCGPVAVAAMIGVKSVTVCDVIQQRRKNRRPVKRTYPHELHAAFAHFGYDMTLVANLGINPPTLATWERQRTDLKSAFVVIVTDKGVAVRGRWFCDTHTRGVPVRIKKAPHRRKRVTVVDKIRLLRDRDICPWKPSLSLSNPR